LTSKVIQNYILSNENICKELIKHLPSNQQSMEHLVINLNSPQFAQALISLSDALESENYNVLISSFGLNFTDGSGASCGVEGFIKCIIKKFQKK
jgi:hypothetical protein